MKLLASQQTTPQHNPAAPDFTPATPTSEASPAITSTAASSGITTPAVMDISSASPVTQDRHPLTAHFPWDDYATMVDLQLAREKQLIQLRMSVFLDTLGIAHDTSLTVDEVLDELQTHFKNQRNEALRRQLLCCKQKEGETFSDLAEEVNLCSGDPVTCVEAQLKMYLLMRVKYEELVQHLISLHADVSLQDMVTYCRSFEATKDAVSAIHSSPSQLCAIISYQKRKQRDKATRSSPPRSQSKPSSPKADSCCSCNRRHDLGKCPAKEDSCMNCGHRGHWPQTARFPAKDVMLQDGTLRQDIKISDASGHRRRCHNHCQEASRTARNSKQQPTAPRVHYYLHIRHCQELAIVSPQFPKPIMEVKHATGVPSHTSLTYQHRLLQENISYRVTLSSQYFTTTDALYGYWQHELAEEDQHLTTFILPYGRYKHRRGPMGFSATGDVYCC
ncbi:hypothetical protein C7M84_004316 [Penaeus vannamei]|uniref:Uncharacterized protein n=1 Tax=Penaeus vannamei TaxID=6689 RepID=A0A423TKT5_PENVA|nr:hypothetical protein C7M84_004316 [Penaeus vannamei]